MPDDRPKISEPAQRVLDAIVVFVREHGYPPTVRQLAASCGLSSTSTVQAHLLQLVTAGYIKRDGFGSRTIRVIGFDTDADIARDLARTDPVYPVDGPENPEGAVFVRRCSLCREVAEVLPACQPDEFPHATECPWLRARKLYAE